MNPRLSLAVVFLVLAVVGCSDNSTSPPSQREVVRTIDDMNYVRGTYFLIQSPARQVTADSRIDFTTLRVFVDDMNGANDQGARAGYGEIDPSAPPSDATRLIGRFDQLRELVDYEVTLAPYGNRFPVLVLKHALSPSEMLAVAYEEDVPGAGRRSVGSVPACSVAGCDSVHLKLLQAPHDVYMAKASDTDWYETDYRVAPFNVVREQELRNVYDLGFRNVPAGDLEVRVRRYGAGLDESNDAVNDHGEIVGYLQVLGIDLFKDNGTGVAAVGPDIEVDRFTNATFLDLEKGLLFFPDLRPFDPRIAGRPDATPEEDEFFKSRIPAVDTSIPGLRARVLWPKGLSNPPGSTSPITPAALESNPRVYDKRNILATTDRRFYLYVRGPESALP